MPKRFFHRLRSLKRLDQAEEPARSTKMGSDWANVLLTGATLIVGIVGLWNTFQISGMEDYFRSEISRRNAELNNLSERESHLSARAHNSSEQISLLEQYRSQLTNAAIAQSVKIDEGQSEINRISQISLNASNSLEETRSELRIAQESVRAERRRLDLIFRRDVYGQFATNIIFSGIRSNRSTFDMVTDIAHEENIGRVIVESVTSKQDYSESSEVIALSALVRSRFESFCPGMRDVSIQVPSVRSLSTIRMEAPNVRNFRTQASYDAAFRAANEAWNAEYSEARRQEEAAREAIQARIDALQRQAEACVCAALVTSDVGRAQICPTES